MCGLARTTTVSVRLWLVLVVISALFVNTTTWGWPVLLFLLVGAVFYIVYKLITGE